MTQKILSKNKLKEINDQIRSDTSWIAFRKVYLDLIKERKVLTVFRPGPRPCGSPQGYCENQIVNVRVIDEAGANWADLPPKFLHLDLSQIKMKKIELKKINELTESDFKDSSPDVKNVEALKYHLGLMYNLFLKDLSDDSIVTKISFNYIDK